MEYLSLFNNFNTLLDSAGNERLQLNVTVELYELIHVQTLALL